MIHLLLSLLFLMCFSSQALAISGQGNFVLTEHFTGKKTIGLYTFDPQTIAVSPFGLPEESHGTSLTSFSLFLFGHHWMIQQSTVPKDFTRLSASISSDPSVPIQTTINYGGLRSGVGLLGIFGGHTYSLGAPFHGGNWQFESRERRIFTRGTIRVQPTPEPSTMFLYGTGLAVLAGWRWKKNKTQ